ncbi:SagB family peptide dehydrogenase [Streptacidiphilus rugosus]|uniref:SagB family peptide dehydrogenase n=1 Tax=Streptacidiphilus rugosus TaxID=405783 RepID=UPI0006909C5E|nr:SagB family peptide dehydrogenase [Streptacidiphilus rugosus]
MTIASEYVGEETGARPEAGPEVGPEAEHGAVHWRLGLRRDAELDSSRPGGTLQVTAPFGALALGAPPAGIRAALAALAGGERSEDELAATVVRRDGEAGLLRWHLMLRKLDGHGLLEHALHLDRPDAEAHAPQQVRPVARLRVVGRGAGAPGPAPDPAGRLRLSRFATATPQDGLLAVRAPGNPLAVELGPAGAVLLGALADWTTPALLAHRAGSLPLDAVRQALRLFAAAGLLTQGGPGREQPEERRLAQWSAADLAFHAHTRFPGTVAASGGTYPGAARFAPEPASPPPFPGERIALPVPDLELAAGRERPFAQILEDRRSIRDHDEEPLTVDQLAELLYRTVRRRQTFVGSDGQELADRPCPSGGAVHELEVYPLVGSCAGVPAGLWHYATDRHELERVAEPGPATAALLTAARETSLMTADPQVLLLITARFGRVMWKYEAVAYPLILKHVGVLYQSLYLTGTAMGLAVCGLGGGDAADFATASGLDWLTEGTVGEFVVGSRPATLRQDIGVPRREARR